MYTLAHLAEIGNDLPLSTLNGEDNVSMFTWFLLVFWLNVGAMMVAGRGMFGLTAAGVASASGLTTHFYMVDRAGSRSKAEKAFRTIKKKALTEWKLR